tara:strand:+ start:1994 stop:2905 length:912 start_codon:yes stop_codon:yes gene_type:complete
MKATRDFFGDYLIELGKNNEDIVIVNCDLGDATRTIKFKEYFPKRYIEVGIAEANAVSIASGLSREGLKPFVTSFGHFLTGKFLEIFQSIGLNDANVTLVGTHAGLAIGKDGPTQMGLRDVALMRLLPNIKIYQPINEEHTQNIMDELIEVNGPKYLRLNRQPQEFFEFNSNFIFGSPEEIIKGDELLIITQGAPTIEAYNAIHKCDKKSSVGLLCISSIPVNKKHVSEILIRYKKILIVEDHYVFGGISDLISRILSEEKINIDFNVIAVEDYGQSGDPSDLYELYNLNEFGIKNTIEKLLK